MIIMYVHTCIWINRCITDVLTVHMITVVHQVYEFLILSQGDYIFHHRHNKA